MKKRILAFVLSGCMLIQNSALLVQAAEVPAYTQVETGDVQGKAGNGAAAGGNVSDTTEEDTGGTYAEGGNAVQNGSISEGGNTAGNGEEASEAEAGNENTEGSGEDKASEEDRDENTTGNVGEASGADNGEEAPEGNEAGDTTGNESETSGAENEEENTEENGSGNAIANGEEASEVESGKEAIKEDEETEDTAENMTDVSGNDAEEGIGEAVSRQNEDIESSAQDNVVYAYYEIPSDTDTDADDISMSALSDSKGLYFSYVENDKTEHTGTLKGYVSDASTVVVPHKLDKTYMVEIGDSAFKNMDDKDTSNTSKLPSQSTSGKTLLSSGEDKILKLLNADRIKKGKIPLVMNSTLRAAARRKSLDMINQNYFNHKAPNGEYTDKWLSDCGYPFRLWAENIAYNYENAEKLYNQWYNSQGHYNNMMNDNCRSIGIGVYKASDGKIMGTQIFSDTIFQNITDVTVEFGYEKIGKQAFYGCSNLKYITIPSTVTDIAADAFSGCKNLTIRGKEGSYAETYASAYGITFKAVKEKNPITKFGFSENSIFMEVDEWDFAELSISPIDYKHLIKTEKTETPEEKGKTVADFQTDGTIHALSKGTLTIKAKAGDLEDTCIVTVGVAAPVNIKKLSFYDNELVLYEGESIKPLYKVEPVNTTDTIEMTSSDANIFAVNEDDPSMITAIKAGEAQLTVTGLDNDGNVSASASIDVRVLTVDETLEAPEGIKAVTNITPKLEGVSLPEGFSWKEPQTKLKADNKQPVQYFAAQYENNDTHVRQDCIIPVAVSKASGMLLDIDGVSLAANKKLSMLSTYELIPSIKASGADIDDSFFDVSFSIDNSQVLSITENTDNNKTAFTLTPKSAGKCTVTVEVKLKDVNGRYGPANKFYGKYKKKYKFQVENTAYISGFQVMPEGNPDGVTLLEDGSLQVDEDATKFQIRVTATDGNGAEKNTALKFKADKSGVLKVSAVKGKNGLAEVTVRKNGEAHITVTAKDNSKHSADIAVYVKKVKPQLNGKSWILNKLKPDAAVPVDIQAAEDNPIQEIILYEDKEAKKVAKLFDISLDAENNEYEIGFKDGKISGVTKSSYKLFMKVITDGTEKPKEFVYPITVKMKNTKPSVKFKQPEKINLFYKDAQAVLEIDPGKETIEDITQINVTNSTPHFEVEFEAGEGSKWNAVITPVGVNALNYKKVAKAIELRIDFKDYGSEYSVTKKVNVKKCYKKAALVSTYPQSMIYSTTGTYQTVIRIMDKSSNEILTVGGDDNVEVRLDKSMSNKLQLTADDGEQDIHLQLLNTKLKSLNAKIMVSHDNWLEEQSCSVKLDISAQTPTFALEKTKISLNSNLAGQEIVDIRAYASKNEEVKVVRLKEIDIVGTNSAAKKLLNEEKLTICPQKNDGKRSLRVCLNSSGVKNGTYKYNVYGWCMLGENRIQKMNPVMLTIVVTNKQPSASMKANGKLSLDNPENTKIIYTPNLSNAIGEIKSASLSGAYASQFSVFRLGDGTYQVKLKSNAKLTKGKYKLHFTFILDNGIRVTSKAVTIKI